MFFGSRIGVNHVATVTMEADLANQIKYTNTINGFNVSCIFRSLGKSEQFGKNLQGKAEWRCSLTKDKTREKHRFRKYRLTFRRMLHATSTIPQIKTMLRPQSNISDLGS